MKQSSRESRRPPAIVVTCAVFLLAAMAGEAQIPEEFTNLKVLPEDISKRELTGIMRGFASALDVRCNHCHVGESPDSLEGYDFASDEKETKRTARVMLRMVGEINTTFLPQTGREGLVEVRCATCHRGVQKPQLLDRIVLSTIDEQGLDEAMARYRELREEHFGAGAYDFSAASLDAVTESLAMQKGDREGAMAINRLNLEFNPESDYTLYLHARLLLRSGDRAGAIAALERAIAANPDAGWLVGQLEELKKQGEQD